MNKATEPKKKHFKDVINIAMQLLRGLDYIQGGENKEFNFLHLDLKAENIMINMETKRIKFIDFGFIQDADKHYRRCGTLMYFPLNVRLRNPGP